MYHCHTYLYLAGCTERAFEIIKDTEPLAHFSHSFVESVAVDKELAAKADVIFANLHGWNVQDAVRLIIESKRGETGLILLADKEQIPLITDQLEGVMDIWATPMSDEEIRFRFLRWQKTYRDSKDAWQTKQFLDAAINSTPNLVWYKDKHGIHEKVNNSFCSTVNKTMDQVEGRGHAYIWDVEEDDPACIESEQKVMSSRRTCISEETIQVSDGLRTLITYKSPLYDIDGSVMGTVGLGIDVTREREYEQEVIKKARMLETIFTSIECGVLCHSLDGTRIISVNKAALRILGCDSKEELMEEGFDMVAASVFEEDKPGVQSSMKELKEVGDSCSVEYRVQHKNGEIVHVLGNVKLLEENGEVFYQRFLLDCTAQKQQEEKNAQYQMELIQALTIDYKLVCFVDLDTGRGTVLQSDDPEGQLFGGIFNGDIVFRECMERYGREFVHAEDREMFQMAAEQERIRAELQGKRSYCVRYRVVRAQSVEYFEVKVVRAGIWERQFGMVIGFRNVDEQIRSEMQKKDILESALAQANRANKAKSVFLSNMSHDIRTPMNAIVGFTTLAITHIDRSDQVKEYLEKIMASGNHLLSLINDVLDMSRIESGKIQLEEKVCSLPDIVHGLCNILQGDIRAKRLELYIDTVDVLNEDIYCDKLRLNQVLLNLVSNAVKYTPEGGTINVRITEQPVDREGYAGYVFTVKDTGIGMSEEFLQHIFEPFEREENSTISGIQGTGLGMAITKNIVDMMNGNIEVQSEQGVGTQFDVSFIFRTHVREELKQNIPELKNCRALVVDSDKDSCESVSHMLGQIGMRAEWAVSEEEAVLQSREAAMQGDDFRVYVIGWMLPEIDGIGIARRIREEIEQEAIVIVLTACDWADIEDEAKQAGVTAFCSKPLFLSELMECLDYVLHGEKHEVKEDKTGMQNLKEARILLAEDVELNQEIAVEILGDAGFVTEVAGNGQEAVDMLRRSEPGYYQLILMDIQMPVMNGYEATKAIRRLKNKELASIPILAMSANAFEEDKQEALRSGMNGHIAKPIDIDSMFETLRNVLSR